MINKLYTHYAEYDGGINGTAVDTVMAEGSIGVLEQAYKHRRIQRGMTPEVNTGYSEAESELDRCLKDDLPLRQKVLIFSAGGRVTVTTTHSVSDGKGCFGQAHMQPAFF